MGENKSYTPIRRSELYVSLINTRKWRKIRLRKLAYQPLCEVCLSQGRTTAAQEVHHIASIELAPTVADARSRAYDFDNLMSVCRKCHHDIHNRSRKDERKNHFLESLSLNQ